MKNKKFDCIKMKQAIQEKMWKEAGGSFEGLLLLHEKTLKESELHSYLAKSRKKESKSATAQ